LTPVLYVTLVPVPEKSLPPPPNSPNTGGSTISGFW
jgi:hypothetical protein